MCLTTSDQQGVALLHKKQTGVGQCRAKICLVTVMDRLRHSQSMHFYDVVTHPDHGPENFWLHK